MRQKLINGIEKEKKSELDEGVMLTESLERNGRMKT